MHLIQLLLPLYDNTGSPFPNSLFDELRNQLTEKFGGLTAYMRSPAIGLWKEEDNTTVRDEIVIFEVMTEAIEQDWWEHYHETLRTRFRQDELIIRVSEVQLLGKQQ